MYKLFIRSCVLWTAVCLAAGISRAHGFPSQSVSQPSSKQGKALTQFLRRYLGRPYPTFERGRPTRYSVFWVDLRDDGAQDAIVYLTGRGWCGSGGCVTLILVPADSSYRVLTRITITWPPIRVLASKTNGWHDITVMVHGGGIMEPYEAKLTFNGKSYPNNPTIPPARRLTKSAPAKMVVPLSALADGKPLYPEK